MMSLSTESKHQKGKKNDQNAIDNPGIYGIIEIGTARADMTSIFCWAALVVLIWIWTNEDRKPKGS